jgi:glycerate 2-kinase
LSLPLVSNYSYQKINIDLNEIVIKVASDSDIVLTGKKGQAQTFGPQKGSNQNEIDYLDKGYKNISDIIFKLTKKNIDIPYAGAGGGMGAGLLGFLGAELIPGAKFISEQINFSSELEQADILIVSEGKLDESTLSNKAPFYFSNLARKLNKRVICIVGKQDIKLDIFDKIYAPDNKHIQLQKSKIIQNLQSQTMNFLNDIQNGVFNEKN